MDRTYISALERGLYAATIETVADLATCLDVEPHQMLLPNLIVEPTKANQASVKDS
jgi:hypothetical protein